MTDSDERAEVIARINELQYDLGRALAYDRSLPVLASTLTMQQFKVVMILSLYQSASGQELARRLGVGLGTVTGIVDRLVARRLVARHEDPDDRRIRRVELTPAGRELADQVVHAGQSRVRAVLELLDTDTLHTFESVMRRFVDAALRLAEES